jgi:hypothetical protein
MNRSLSLVAFGHATSLFLAITFVLCVGFDLVFPQMAMYRSWQALCSRIHVDQLVELPARSRGELRLRMVCHADLGAPVQRVKCARRSLAGSTAFYCCSIVDSKVAVSV